MNKHYRIYKNKNKLTLGKVEEAGSDSELKGFLEDTVLQMRDTEGRTGVAIACAIIENF